MRFIVLNKMSCNEYERHLMTMPTREVGCVGALLRGRAGRASNEPQGHKSTDKNNKLHEPQARDMRPHSDIWDSLYAVLKPITTDR
jgi:hypothetical protein